MNVIATELILIASDLIASELIANDRALKNMLKYLTRYGRKKNL